MTTPLALSMREALARLARRTPGAIRTVADPIAREAIASDYIMRDAGVPATSCMRDERVVTYCAVENAELPLVLGAYGSVQRVREWLPGLPRHIDRPALARLLDERRAPVELGAPFARYTWSCGLDRLPVPITTDRDAGPYITLGVVCAGAPEGGPQAVSVHRLLVIDDERLTIWMLPSRQLRTMMESALLAGHSLPVTINIGAPPAVVVASALSTRWLPPGCGKLDIAGALAQAPVGIEPVGETFALAGSEIILEGQIGGRTVDECRQGRAFGISMPEFLGYDGNAQEDLPVVEITAVSIRPDAVYQAVIGPGREQSNILGLAGALTVGFSLDHRNWPCDRGPEIVDLAFPAAGGGMLLLIAQIHLADGTTAGALDSLALRLFSHHPFVKLIVFVDEDVDVASEEDVLWALITRANLSCDVHSFDGFPRLSMDPSQHVGWRGGTTEASARSYIDATRAAGFRSRAKRSFAAVREVVA